MYGWDDDYRNKHLTQIAERLAKENIKLIVKLHPTTIKKNVQVNSSNIILLDKVDLDTLVFYSIFCIAHISTTVNIPILMNKPILIPKWDNSKNVIDYYTNNKVANAWLKCDDKLDLNVDKQARNTFVNEYITITEPIAMKNIIKEILG
jgi:CDP-glycerol glycerophosphotransferase (TagB/SpsB family)